MSFIKQTVIHCFRQNVHLSSAENKPRSKERVSAIPFHIAHTKDELAFTIKLEKINTMSGINICQQ